MKRKIIDLSGNAWQMERLRIGQGEAEGFHELPAEFQGTTFSWNHASVPGDVYTDLFKAGEIEDPYFGRNFHKAKWVADYEWWYIRRFDVDEKDKGKNVRLLFEGIDYSCKIWLNGHYLGTHEGMFSTFHFDVDQYLNYSPFNRDGSNIILIKLDPPPKNLRICGGKKVNFSGDYFTGIVPFGIWRPIKLEITEKIRLDDCRVDFTLEDDVTKGKASFTFEVENLTSSVQKMSLDIKLEPKNFKGKTFFTNLPIEAQPKIKQFKTCIDLKEPHLWWPHDMGEQNLYTMKIELKHGSSIYDTVEKVTGIREITMQMNPGFTKDEVENPWTFTINKTSQFLRSACWGGQPSFLYGQNSLSKYETRLAMVKDCNINNLRIFGWHPPEVPEFYELCDQLGITVWTNFALATQAYPNTKKFLDEVLHECTSVVKQRAHHPSQIFWMGGEEVFFSGAHETGGNKNLMIKIGEDVVKKLTNVPYGLASPLSSESGINMGFKPNESFHGNGHYYQEVGQNFMEDYYPSLNYAVIPEFTAASAPNVNSLKKFIPKDELWPMGVSWGYHWADIDFLRDINFEVFNDNKMGSLEEFVEATQIAQGTVYQFVIETYRRRKPKMSAVAFCHFITHWPDIKWGIVDYYGEKKLSYDFIKRAYQSVLPSVKFIRRRWKPSEKFNSEFWIVNDVHKKLVNVTCKWSIEYHQKIVADGYFKDLQVESNSSTKFGKIDWTLPGDAQGDFLIKVKLFQQNKEIATNHYVLLVGDQQKAKAHSLKLYNENQARRKKYGPSIYRYWPKLWEWK